MDRQEVGKLGKKQPLYFTADDVVIVGILH